MTGPLDYVQLDLVDSLDKAFELKRWLGERREILGIDTESAGLSVQHDPNRLIQLGDLRMGWSVPVDRWLGLAEEILNAYDGPVVYHNSKYDVQVLEKWTRHRPNWSQIDDTMALLHLDDPTRSKALKTAAALLVDPRAASSKNVLDVEMSRNKWTWGTVPIVREGAGSSYWIYSALDPVLTAHLYDYCKRTRQTFDRSYQLELGVLRSIAAMETKGVRIDVPYCDHMLGVIDEYAQRLRAWIKETHGVDNPGSTQQCIRKFKELERQITSKTASGYPSLDKEQLQAFLIGADYDHEVTQDELPSLPGNDLARAILDLRRVEKFATTYFRPLIDGVDSGGRVHATIWPTGARTSRMSITDPGLQTLPRKDPTVRDAFVPTDDHVLITIDADQIEMRLAAHFSQDEGLRRAFTESPDFFNTVASDAWGDTITKKDPRRQTFKNASYAKLYGATVKKIAMTAGVPVHTMELVMARFDQNYPGIVRFQQECLRLGKKRGREEGRPYVMTPYGRRMYGDKGEEHKLTNYAIQCAAAEVLKQGICDLHAVGLGDYLTLPVHDELVLEVPKEEAMDVKATLEETLNAVGRDYFVSLTWSADVITERWGDKYR